MSHTMPPLDPVLVEDDDDPDVELELSAAGPPEEVSAVPVPGSADTLVTAG
ncbi:MAG: hypothetical protein H0T76_09005 [Nannocystis sp.]|nr:hypothetical protein [Nannocystis sp.]MBA3546607.1 hypothetical protein [Nannocystis sp.]